MDKKYRLLKEGEIIQGGDEVDMCRDGWRDDPVWVKAVCLGKKVPDSTYPSHRRYRREVKENSNG